MLNQPYKYSTAGNFVRKICNICNKEVRESFVFKDTEVYFPLGRFIHSQGKVEFTARLSIFFSLILTGIKTLGANFGLELSVKRFLGHRTRIVVPFHELWGNNFLSCAA